MKAVIVEIKNGFAAILSDDGCITKVKNNNYEIGQIIQYNKARINFSKKIAAFSAAAAVFVILGTGALTYASPYSYVSLDVNPSIEYTVNRFELVLSVKAVNDDGEEILKKIKLDNLKNKTIQKALSKTVEQISEQGYFNGNSEGGIVITTSGKNIEKADKLAQELRQSVEQEIDKTDDNVVVEADSVGLERVKEAKKLGVTPGKLNLVEELQQSSADPASIDIKQWLNRPVRDIMKATKENKEQASLSGIKKSDKDTEQPKPVQGQAINDNEKDEIKQENYKANSKNEILKADNKDDVLGSEINEETSAKEKGQKSQSIQPKVSDHPARKIKASAKKARNSSDNAAQTFTQRKPEARSNAADNNTAGADDIVDTAGKSERKAQAGNAKQKDGTYSADKADTIDNHNKVGTHEDTDTDTNKDKIDEGKPVNQTNDNRNDNMDNDSMKADKAAENAADPALSDSQSSPDKVKDKTDVPPDNSSKSRSGSESGNNGQDKSEDRNSVQNRSEESPNIRDEADSGKSSNKNKD